MVDSALGIDRRSDSAGGKEAIGLAAELVCRDFHPASSINK